MVVYVDRLLLMGISLDTLMLWGTAKLTGFRVSYRRLLMAVVFGAFAQLFLLLEGSLVLILGWRLVISWLMLILLFGWSELFVMWRRLVCFASMQAVSGGLLFGMTIWNKKHLGLYSVGISLLLFIFFIQGLRKEQIVQMKRKFVLQRDLLAKVEAQLGRKTVAFQGLVDTGNCLRDPLTGFPVIVLEASLLEHIVPLELLRECGKNPIRSFPRLLQYWEGDRSGIGAERLRLIPYRVINEQTRWMLALRPDQVTIRLIGERTVASMHEVLLGLELGSFQAGRQIRGLVPGSLFPI